MGTFDAELIRKWIKQKIMFEQATITYRNLVQECGCGVDQARELLDSFYGSEDGKRLKVQPTYLIFGEDKNRVSGCIKSLRIERAKDCELEDFKSKFHSVSCVQIYSISAIQAPDANLLKSCANEPISFKPKNSTDPHKHESRKQSEPSHQEPNLGQLKIGTSTGKEESSKTTLAGQTRAETITKSEGSKTQKDDNLLIEANEGKPNSKRTTVKPIKVQQKVESDDEVSSVAPSKTQHTQKDEHKETKTNNNKSNACDQSLNSKNRNGDDEAARKDSVKDTDTKHDKTSSRKRVRKTRIVKKKKIIRVKDKKGYRVNREEIEEVEESYSDWEEESSANETSEAKPIKKKIKHSQLPLENDSNEQKLNSSADNTSTKNPRNSKPLVTDPTKNHPHTDVNNSAITKKKNSAPNSKDQYNITSFFKKG